MKLSPRFIKLRSDSSNTFLCHIFPTESYVEYKQPRTKGKGLEQNRRRNGCMQSKRQEGKGYETQKKYSEGVECNDTDKHDCRSNNAIGPYKFTNIGPSNNPSGCAQHTHNK